MSLGQILRSVIADTFASMMDSVSHHATLPGVLMAKHKIPMKRHTWKTGALGPGWWITIQSSHSSQEPHWCLCIFVISQTPFIQSGLRIERTNSALWKCLVGWGRGSCQQCSELAAQDPGSRKTEGKRSSTVCFSCCQKIHRTPNSLNVWEKMHNCTNMSYSICGTYS